MGTRNNARKQGVQLCVEKGDIGLSNKAEESSAEGSSVLSHWKLGHGFMIGSDEFGG